MSGKRTQYERTSRDRAVMRAAAQLFGWQVLDVLGAYLTPENEVVVITKDGSRFGASARPVGDLPTAPPRPEDGVPKRVYAPASWGATEWNSTVAALQKGKYTKDEVLERIRTGSVSDKQKSQASKVIETLPDTPDWYTHLPLAEES